MLKLPGGVHHEIDVSIRNLYSWWGTHIREREPSNKHEIGMQTCILRYLTIDGWVEKEFERGGGEGLEFKHCF